MDKSKKYITNNFEQTQKMGETFAHEILVSGLQETAAVLALSGDLGAGKTTFLQGFAKGLGVKENVLSPTFVIMKKFELKNHKFKTFYHFDCYRLENEEDIESLGFKEIVSNPQNIVAIEWPEKIGNILPKNSISITFEHLEETKREIVF